MKHTSTQTAFLHAQRNFAGEVVFQVFPCDMTAFGHTLIATQDFAVAFNIPKDFNLEAEAIKALKAEKQQAMAAHHVHLMAIDERIQSLQALEYTPA